MCFDNFDLHIDPSVCQAGKQYYSISVSSSPEGETKKPHLVHIPSNDEQMHHWIKQLQNGQISSDELRYLGQCLATYLLPQGEIYTLFQRCLVKIKLQYRKLRLRLHITPPELNVLPWEYAYNEDGADFFCLPETNLLSTI